MITETTERDLIEEVEELLAKATPGPWVWESVGEFDGEASNAGGFTYQHIRAGHLGVADTYHASGAQWPDGSVTPPRDGNAYDANLIAAAPELLRRLVEEVKRRDDLLMHMWIHSGFQNNGYWQMTTEQKALYDAIVERESKRRA